MQASISMRSVTDLAEMLARQAFTYDENRPDAVARRRKTNQRTTRENIAALVDEDSFIEYGSLAHRCAACPPQP